MDNLGVKLSQYQHIEGGGAVSPQELFALEKALEVGQLRGGDANVTSGGALKLESLEKTLKVLQFKESDLGLWLKVPKLPAYSTVEEYNRLNDYGDDSGGFIGEGDLPDESDSSYERVAELVKYIGTTGSTTLQAQLVATNVGDIKKHKVETCTKWVLRKADRALFRGHAGNIPKEWNGYLALHQKAWSTLEAWHNSEVVIDLRGSHLSEDKVENAFEGIIENHGAPNLLIAPTKVLTNFSKQFHSMKLIQPIAQQVGSGIVGQRIKQYESQFGTLEIGYDKFMWDQRPRLSTMAPIGVKAPAKPTADGVAPVVAVTDTLNRFGSAFAGDYFVGVSAINEYGESAITMLSNSVVAVAPTESLDLKFTAGAGTYAATGYRIYMSKKDPAGALAITNLYPVFDVSASDLANGFDGALAGIIRNRNRFIPDTAKAIITEADEEVWGFKQLAPLMKMDLARVSTADRFMVLMFGTPQLYAPKKMVIVINAGAYVAA